METTKGVHDVRACGCSVLVGRALDDVGLLLPACWAMNLAATLHKALDLGFCCQVAWSRLGPMQGPMCGFCQPLAILDLMVVAMKGGTRW